MEEENFLPRSSQRAQRKGHSIECELNFLSAFATFATFAVKNSFPPRQQTRRMKITKLSAVMRLGSFQWHE
jgi:hypothetical protein